MTLAHLTEAFRERSVKPALRRAIELAGGQAALAERCGCSQQNISRALQTGRVTLELAMLIEATTGGQVPSSRLFPISTTRSTKT